VEKEILVSESDSGTQTGFRLLNSLSYANCEINIIVYEPVVINSLDFRCSNSCMILINSKNLTINTLSISTDTSLDINSIYLATTDLTVKSSIGNYYFNYLKLAGTANLENHQGDIAV
jgi:hypothetical protein